MTNWPFWIWNSRTCEACTEINKQFNLNTSCVNCEPELSFKCEESECWISSKINWTNPISIWICYQHNPKIHHFSQIFKPEWIDESLMIISFISIVFQNWLYFLQIRFFYNPHPSQKIHRQNQILSFIEKCSFYNMRNFKMTK